MQDRDLDPEVSWMIRAFIIFSFLAFICALTLLLSACTPRQPDLAQAVRQTLGAPTTLPRCPSGQVLVNNAYCERIDKL